MPSSCDTSQAIIQNSGPLAKQQMAHTMDPQSQVTTQHPSSCSWQADTQKFLADASGMYSASRIPAGTFTSDGILATELGVQGQRAERGIERGTREEMPNLDELCRDRPHPPRDCNEGKAKKERQRRTGEAGMEREGAGREEHLDSRGRQTRRRSLTMLSLSRL